MINLAVPYINGSSPADLPQTGLPLDRFLPPYYPGSISDWLQRFAPPGSLVFDPFGQDPYVNLALARAGFAQRRKQLRNSLKSGLSMPSDRVEAALQAAGESPAVIGDVIAPTGEKSDAKGKGTAKAVKCEGRLAF